MLNDVKILRSRSSNACKNMIKRGNKKQIKQYFKDEDGTFDVLPKKEVIKLKKEWEKLEKNLGGIRNMSRVPDAIFVVDHDSPKVTQLLCNRAKI